MNILVTGGSGVLGRAALPLLRAQGHDVAAPAHGELDLFDATAVGQSVAGCDAVLHLATRIPPPQVFGGRDAWRENDRLRTEASRLLVDAALAADASTYVLPTIAFVYSPVGQVDEDSPYGDVDDHMRSALDAERETARFAAAGRRGVVLRLGLLDGDGTGSDAPNAIYGTTLDVTDAGRALVAALELPSGIYNVCRDGERVSNARFKAATGWGAI